MRKLLLLTTFFTFAPVFLIVILGAFFYVTTHADQRAHAAAQKSKVAFAALPTAQNIFSDTTTVADARVEMLTQFFEKYDSPLKPFAKDFVANAVEYGLDYRLLPSIAMQETNLCHKSNPDSYNCWGFGVYGGKYKYFDSYPQAIATISKTLAEKYRDRNGLVTPDEIQRMYTPTSNGSWAHGVNHFMDTLE